MQVTPRNFFTDFMLDPFSERISKTDRKICFLASFILGLFTAGLIHLSMAIYNWAARNIENHTRAQSAGEGHNHPTVHSSHRRTPSANQRDIEMIRRELENTLEALEEQITDDTQLHDFKKLSHQIFDNSSLLITECAEESELRRSIVNNGLKLTHFF